MSSEASIRLLPRGEGVQSSLIVPVAAHDMISTTLVVSADVRQLPTLLSVERIVGRLASLGLVLADADQQSAIAHLVNKKFLSSSPNKWKDQDLPLRVVRANEPGSPESLRAVAAVRQPVLFAADTALRAAGSYGSVDRRANEIRLVDDIRHAVEIRKPVWQQFSKTAFSFIGMTVLSSIVDNLIGVPIVSIINSALHGAGRIAM